MRFHLHRLMETTNKEKDRRCSSSDFPSRASHCYGLELPTATSFGLNRYRRNTRCSSPTLDASYDFAIWVDLPSLTKSAVRGEYQSRRARSASAGAVHSRAASSIFCASKNFTSRSAWTNLGTTRIICRLPGACPPSLPPAFRRWLHAGKSVAS